MYELAVTIQFTALIPIITALILWKFNTLFLKRHIIYSYISIISEVIGLYCAYYFRNNLLVYEIYFYINMLVLYWLWSRYSVFRDIFPRFFLWVTSILFCATLIASVFYDSDVGFTICSILNLGYMLFIGLLYYHVKIQEEQLTISLREPVFVVASAYILYGLSVIMIFTTLSIFEKNDGLILIFTRGFFYLIFNLFLSFAYYLNYNQVIK